MNAVSKPEAGAWQDVKDGWRQLYGNFARGGWSIEQHDFSTTKPVDWARSFHPDSLEVCLNSAGRGTVRDRARESVYETNTVGFYCVSGSGLRAERVGGQEHAFITLEASRAYLGPQIESQADHLQPSVRAWLSEKKSAANLAGPVAPMSLSQQNLFSALCQPPVAPPAYALWYQSKMLEALSQVLFQPQLSPELFCQRQKRVARERVERAVQVLRERLTEPPDIEELGAAVGCSPFYLSRIFSREMGMTIPQFIRKVRMERAAEYLLTGKFNVTEAAMEVGYSSLSHFSKAFCQDIGCCPALFPSATALVEEFKLRMASSGNSSFWGK